MSWLGPKSLLCGLSFLAACSNSANGVDALSDAELAELAPAVTLAPLPAEQAGAPGFFERLFNGTLTAAPSVATSDAETAQAPQNDVTSPPEPVETTGEFWSNLGQGSSIRANAAPSDASIAQMPVGEMVPFGQVAMACGVRGRDLGTLIERSSGYSVYDTSPMSSQPRTLYITGFSDRCARQFTGALMLFGDIGTHELVRYSRADGGLRYSDTDTAYEEIKARYCGVSQGQPCGSRVDRLSRRTTFLTVYQRFGSNAAWADMLLSDGKVAAIDIEGR